MSLWDAIIEFTESCGGDTSSRTVSDRRIRAVSAVSRALAAAASNPAALKADLSAVFDQLRLSGGRRADAVYAWTREELVEAMLPLLSERLGRRVV